MPCCDQVIGFPRCSPVLGMAEAGPTWELWPGWILEGRAALLLHRSWGYLHPHFHSYLAPSKPELHLLPPFCIHLLGSLTPHIDSLSLL